MTIDELRTRVWEENLRLPAEGLVALTWGNVSARSDDGDLVAIKPSGVAYPDMKPDDIVVLDLDGNVVAGEMRPSTDTPSHLALYRAFDGVGGIVHVHSVHATAFAQARRPIPCLGTTHADHFAGPVPVTRPLTADEVAEDYEANTGTVVIDHFRAEGLDPMHVPGVLLAGHGPFVWGKNATKAVDNAVAIEQIARMAILSGTIAGGEAPDLEPWVLDPHFQRKHGPAAYYGQG
ncbi:MAG: L-ribulose-5-phosphate 4-epimerase AraD [Actinomycetota bacterium]|nr:L-ribulose-5-phosphate 4-epimerase AraD [Actinomycetota bacterium]